MRGEKKKLNGEMSERKKPNMIQLSSIKIVVALNTENIGITKTKPEIIELLLTLFTDK